jgi:hypothetical protein
MNASPARAAEGYRAGSRPDGLVIGIGAFAVVELALAAFMVVSPHRFYSAIGPFGNFNAHYLRDVATFEAALGAGLLISLRLPSWRVPVLAVTTIQYALHTLNHLLDIDKADPAWAGYFDFLSLGAGTLLLVWLLRAARARSGENPALPNEGGSS